MDRYNPNVVDNAEVLRFHVEPLAGQYDPHNVTWKPRVFYQLERCHPLKGTWAKVSDVLFSEGQAVLLAETWTRDNPDVEFHIVRLTTTKEVCWTPGAADNPVIADANFSVRNLKKLTR